jgi:hypothetical protein
VIKLDPTSCPFQECAITVTFANAQDYNYAGFCHFNHKLIVQAQSVDRGRMVCHVPALDPGNFPGKVYVGLSFDQAHESELSLPLKIQREPWHFDGTLVGVLLFAVCLGIGMAVVSKMVKTKNVPRAAARGSLVSRVAARRGFM